VWNVCTGVATSVLELATTIAALRKSSLLIDYAPPRAGDIRSSLGNPERAEAELGFRARTLLAAGLAQTLAG
jgi:UDP-glucose 4-epimerase